jgi:hypothetical protein
MGKASQGLLEEVCPPEAVSRSTKRLDACPDLRHSCFIGSIGKWVNEKRLLQNNFQVMDCVTARPKSLP